MIADIFNLPVRKVQTVEASSLGASISGFLALGVFKSPKEAVEAMVHPGDEFVPNPENVKTYDELYKNGYANLYRSLKDIYKYLYNLTLAKLG